MRYCALIIAALTLAGCGSGGGSSDSGRSADPGKVSRADFGADWPLTVESGTLSCFNSAVTFATGGDVYALNGLASQEGGWADVHAIWAKDSLGQKDMLPLIDRGLELC
jgi:hypothetical protein